MPMRLYQVVGRKAPTKQDENPVAYRMKLFAPNEVMAKSRFWYFMHQTRKMKKTTGEILDVNEITEKNSRCVKNYGIWLKYNSRSGTHNMYREYRGTTLNTAVEMMYNDMAGKHRSRNKSIQIIRTAIVADEDCKRPNVTQFHDYIDEEGKDGPKGEKVTVRFPLPHRILRPSSKQLRSVFMAKRPNTHFN
mmetsp:Transcript_37596/g.38278  ORF Transcript_37596/g.38278 Transcript_37596/m.38278 type:complete len:191 (-) Transcript_37596:92-664(-)|eukprot:CAMPEP_0182418650 /NCGR_PEP_ID=MMETSP1167-20130531/3029_1 /TAXON_ID=2988 /ORGANISM="Mallomonas Sp, Strain CCMP3275" /LENGTH=190 /DNA_ID=CAMNT_0024592949 /DNA_START=42 /DNA_END=614 /DNA_ORIENTATION=+